jgi:hypothetical protein
MAKRIPSHNLQVEEIIKSNMITFNSAIASNDQTYVCPVFEYVQLY